MATNAFLSPAGQGALAGSASASAPPPTALNYAFPVTPDVAMTALTNASSPQTRQFIYPLDLKTSRYWMNFMIGTYERPSWAEPGIQQLLGIISLPLADQLVDSATVSYELTPMGPTGAGLMTVLPGGNRATNVWLGAGQGLMNLGAGLMDTAAHAAGGVLGTGTSAGALASSGTAVNDYMTVMLKGPTFKVREFAWKFSPRNDQEASVLIQIISAFKNAQAPSYTFTASNAFFSWPNIFQINFASYNNQDMGLRLYEFLPAVLNDLVINYTPAGAPSFYGKTSTPAFYQVTMRFTELEYWMRNNYKGITGLDPNEGFQWDIFLNSAGVSNPVTKPTSITNSSGSFLANPITSSPAGPTGGVGT